ncbi:hypothetical protein HDU79_004595 [Rhizoclosmatium sp. JEL0117]|nr:hypothetical protein HDU79_004595 [Rhizoclosmatium sp. JEL0117]
MPKQTAATLQTVSVERTAASDVANDVQVDLSFTDSNPKATVIETQIEKFLRQARELKAPVFTTEAGAQWYLVVRYDGRIHSKVKSSDMSLSAFCFAFLREQCHGSVEFGVDPALATPELFESVLSALAVSPYYNVKTSRIELDGYRFAIVSHHAKHIETGATEWMKAKANIRPPIPTCSNLTTQVGICVICRDYCHSGHDGLLVGESRTYNCEYILIMLDAQTVQVNVTDVTRVTSMMKCLMMSFVIAASLVGQVL